jgi:hypothetical protein
MGAGGELPSEDRDASYANRIGEILVGAGTVTIERYRKAVDAKPGHENPFDLILLARCKQTQYSENCRRYASGFSEAHKFL